jgi:hypothetical protein
MTLVNSSNIRNQMHEKNSHSMIIEYSWDEQYLINYPFMK